MLAVRCWVLKWICDFECMYINGDGDDRCLDGGGMLLRARIRWLMGWCKSKGVVTELN